MTKLKRYIYGAAGTLAAFSIIASPVLVSAETDTTTVEATVNSAISISNSTATVSVSLIPGASPVESVGSDTVTVSTNDTDGYTLEVAASDATNALSSATGPGTYTISATTPTTPATATTLDTNSWGWCVVGIGTCSGSYSVTNNQADGASGNWIAMPASGSDIEVKSTTGTATNDTTVFYYGVNVDSSKQTDVYTDAVTYTALVK
jgi:hypothetical protein